MSNSHTACLIETLFMAPPTHTILTAAFRSPCARQEVILLPASDLENRRSHAAGHCFFCYWSGKSGRCKNNLHGMCEFLIVFYSSARRHHVAGYGIDVKRCGFRTRSNRSSIEWVPTDLSELAEQDQELARHDSQDAVIQEHIGFADRLF